MVEYGEQLEQLGRLTGQLAHEIKNPLSTIKVNLKLISEELSDLLAAESGQRPPDRQGYKLARALRKISIIQKEADRLEQILDGFLQYIDKTQLQLSSVDLNELVGDMIDFYSPQAQSRSITVRQCLFNKPLVCRIDADMLKQVILNLFINAQQAMDTGGELMIRTLLQAGNAVIQVSDTGVGIAAEKLAHIFDAYYSSRPDGRGLGLAIARKIIEAHNGQIRVDSEPGKGTCFTISLPVQTGEVPV
jgi:signal transduction histidine kinase